MVLGWGFIYLTLDNWVLSKMFYEWKSGLKGKHSKLRRWRCHKVARALQLAKSLGEHQVGSSDKSKWSYQINLHSFCTLVRLLLGIYCLIIPVSSHVMKQLCLPVVLAWIYLHLRAVLSLTKWVVTLSYVGFLRLHEHIPYTCKSSTQ